MGCGVPFLSLQQLAIILSKKNAASSHSIPFCKNKGVKLSNQPKMIPHSKSINFPFLPKFLKNPPNSSSNDIKNTTASSFLFRSLPAPHHILPNPYPCLSVAPQPVASTEFAWSFLVVVWWCIWRFLVFPIKGFDSSTNFTKKLDFVRKKIPGGLQGHYKKKCTRLIYIDPVVCLWSDRRKQSVTKWLV